MKYSLRRLLKSPAFSLTALITIGAAIGANALIFSVVNGVVLKPLPFADPDRLVGAWHVAPGLGLTGPVNQGPTNYFTYRDNKVFDDIGMWDNIAVTITEDTEYPFRDTVRLKVSPAAPVSFPLLLRIPAWAANASAQVNGQTVRAGTFQQTEATAVVLRS